MDIDPQDVVLKFRCPECDLGIDQPLTDLVEVGAPICVDCDIECELESVIVESKD